jgi:hypothetical protein
MTQTQHSAQLRKSLLWPALTAALGFVVYALSAIVGETLEVNADSGVEPAHSHALWESVTGWADEFAIALVGVAGAILAGGRAWRGEPSRLIRTALVLSVVAVITFPAFWAGWSNVFGATSIGLALEHRRRIGSFGAGAWTAIILGSAAFAAGTVACLLG